MNFSFKVALLSLLLVGPITALGANLPNIILIVADDLGYAEIGAYGQELIKTPTLDRLADEGMRFTQFYSGAPVCASSRSVLMTGQHSGHTRVRGNSFPEDNGKQELFPEDITLAEVLKKAGYSTAAIGKWGLGMNGTGGHPNRQGFDYFFGYLSQHHAHNYWPTFLFRNEDKVGLPNVVTPMGNGHLYGAGVAIEKNVYAPDLFRDEALDFIDRNHDRPFFLFFATNVPHANNEATKIRRADGAEVPELGEYKDREWMLGAKRHAAMITRMDSDIGDMLERLEQHGVADNTIVMFTSDNGPHVDHAEPMDFFSPAAPLQGWKMNLWEGGIRVPLVVRWPGKIKAGSVEETPAYFGDIMATFAGISGQATPPDTDSSDMLPLLMGEPGRFESHDFLYWEFRGKDTGIVGLMEGRWKGIIRKVNPDHLELYDLDADIAEARDVSAEHPEIVKVLREYMLSERSNSEIWPSPLEDM
jgi:arylsulfatase A-like enzyme